MNIKTFFLCTLSIGLLLAGCGAGLWSAENFTIEPAGDIHENAGHLHIMINTDCLAAGETVPNDETRLHFGKAQTETELALAPGTYTLCLQAADGTPLWQATG